MLRFVILGCLLLLPAGPALAQNSTSKLDKLWADLADRNEAVATRAALGLAATPNETVPYLAKMLRPVKLEQAAFKTLIKELDSDEFEAREKAYKDLEYYGKAIRTQLEEVLKNQPSPEVRNQVARLLEAALSDEPMPPAPPPQVADRSVSIQNAGGMVKIIIDGKPLDLTPKVIEKLGPQPAWVRASRAAAILEHLGTPEAREVLKTMSAGEADVLPTKSAKEALDRLNR